MDFPVLGPGVSAKFQVTPLPLGVVTDIKNAAWTSSDDVNFPVVLDVSDATGLTATVTIPATENAPKSVTLTWTYTNADGSIAIAYGTFDLTGTTSVNVTTGYITRIA